MYVARDGSGGPVLRDQIIRLTSGKVLQAEPPRYPAVRLSGPGTPRRSIFPRIRASGKTATAYSQRGLRKRSNLVGTPHLGTKNAGPIVLIGTGVGAASLSSLSDGCFVRCNLQRAAPSGGETPLALPRRLTVLPVGGSPPVQWFLGPSPRALVCLSHPRSNWPGPPVFSRPPCVATALGC